MLVNRLDVLVDPILIGRISDRSRGFAENAFTILSRAFLVGILWGFSGNPASFGLFSPIVGIFTSMLAALLAAVVIISFYSDFLERLKVILYSTQTWKRRTCNIALLFGRSMGNFAFVAIGIQFALLVGEVTAVLSLRAI